MNRCLPSDGDTAESFSVVCCGSTAGSQQLVELLVIGGEKEGGGRRVLASSIYKGYTGVYLLRCIPSNGVRLLSICTF